MKRGCKQQAVHLSFRIRRECFPGNNCHEIDDLDRWAGDRPAAESAAFDAIPSLWRMTRRANPYGSLSSRVSH